MIYFVKFLSGGFLLIRDHKHEQDFSLNCFFKSSANLDLKEYENNPGIGRKSVAIPGELKCLQIVYHKYARFYWKTLAEPSIRLARDGFRVSKLLGFGKQLILIKKKIFFLICIFKFRNSFERA